MKKRKILLCLFIVFFIASPNFAEEDEDFIIGEILEVVKDQNIVQVKNRNYIPELILIDFSPTEEPAMGSIYDLEPGNLAKVYPTEMKDGFWHAKKIIVYKGEQEEQILKEMDI